MPNNSSNEQMARNLQKQFNQNMPNVEEYNRKITRGIKQKLFIVNEFPQFFKNHYQIADLIPLVIS